MDRQIDRYASLKKGGIWELVNEYGNSYIVTLSVVDQGLILRVPGVLLQKRQF